MKYSVLCAASNASAYVGDLLQKLVHAVYVIQNQANKASYIAESKALSVRVATNVAKQKDALRKVIDLRDALVRAESEKQTAMWAASKDIADAYDKHAAVSVEFAA